MTIRFVPAPKPKLVQSGRAALMAQQSKCGTAAAAAAVASFQSKSGSTAAAVVYPFSAPVASTAAAVAFSSPQPLPPASPTGSDDDDEHRDLRSSAHLVQPHTQPLALSSAKGGSLCVGDDENVDVDALLNNLEAVGLMAERPQAQAEDGVVMERMGTGMGSRGNLASPGAGRNGIGSRGGLASPASEKKKPASLLNCASLSFHHGQTPSRSTTPSGGPRKKARPTIEIKLWRCET